MAVAQNLVVNLLGNARPLSQAAGKAGGDLEKLHDRAVSSVGGIVRELALLAGAGSFTYFVHQTLEGVDATAKLADSIGITTTALTALQHAGQLSGVAAEQTADALRDLTERIGQAKEGTGEAANYLRKMGLDAQKLAQQKLDKSFIDIAEGISRLPTSAEQMAATMAIFGEAGGRLLPLLKSGENGIRAMMAEAERLGITFDRLEAKRIEEANDAFLRTKQAITGAAQSLVIQLAPGLTAAAQGVQYIVEKYQEWGKHLIAVGVAVGTVSSALWIVKKAKDAVIKAQVLLQSVSGPKGWATLAAGVLVYAGTMTALNAAERGAFSSREQLAEQNQQSVSTYHQLTKSVMASSSAVRQSGKEAVTAAELWKTYRLEAVKLKLLLNDIRQAKGLTSGEREVLSKRAIDQQTGVFSEIRKLKDELEVLQGVATDTDHKIRDLLKQGVPREATDQLRDLIAQRDALKKFREAETARQQGNRESILQHFEELGRKAEQIRESQKTPLQTFNERFAEVQRLERLGLLTKGEAGKEALRLRSDLLSSQQNVQASTHANTALDVQSAAGVDAFNRLFRGGDSGGNVQQQQRDLLEQNRQELNKINQKLAKGQRPIRLGGRS